MTGPIRQFVSDLRTITAGTADPRALVERVAPLVRDLALSKSWLEASHYECDTEQGFGAHLLHEEDDHTLAVMAAAWLPGRGAPPHDHGTWAVVAGVDGTETNTFWTRVDDASRPGHAEIRQERDLVVGPGDVVTFQPDTIHSVRNDSKRVALSLHVYGKHVNHTQRSQFDHERGTERPFILKIAPLVFGFLAAAASGVAQDDPHTACASAGWVPREVLERPVALRLGTGNAHESVTTKSLEAQAFYDQGLNYLHGYVWIEAGRSFRQALRIDPALAMAWLGLSRVYSGLDDPQAAGEAQAQAEIRVAAASPREQRRVALRAKQLAAIADVWNEAKHLEYKRAIDAALAADIGDIELWLLRGNAEEPTAAGRGQRGAAASVAFYSHALTLAPEHAAAHHYLVHSYETMGRIDEALAHGEAFARQAPSIPHAHHMWGHDLRRVGRIDEAIAAFRRTDDLEKAYYAAERIPPALDWHHVHNLDLLATAYQHKGQMGRAQATMREAVALPPPIDRVEFDQKLLSVFLLGREHWDEALEQARVLTRGRWGATRAVGHALSGQAHLGQGQAREARAALEAAEHELADVPAAAVGIGVSRGHVQPWVDALRGQLLLREGALPEGRRILETVARTLRNAPGPDAWIQAIFRLEAIARWAREAGEWDLVELVAHQMLEHDPAYGGTHLALALVAERKGDGVAAAREFAAAETCWAEADSGLPELALVRLKKARWSDQTLAER